MDATNAPKLTSGTTSTKAQIILSAASRVFLANGFTASTTDMIQREAGVSKSTMYALFPTKETMFAAVIEHHLTKMSVELRSVVAHPGDIERTLLEVGAAYLQVTLSPTGLALYRAIVAEASRFPDLSHQFFQLGPRAVVKLVARRLDSAASAGEVNIQPIGCETAAAMFVSMIRGEVLLELLTHPEARPARSQIDRWVKLSVDTFLRSFGATDRR